MNQEMNAAVSLQCVTGGIQDREFSAFKKTYKNAILAQMNQQRRFLKYRGKGKQLSKKMHSHIISTGIQGHTAAIVIQSCRCLLINN